MEGEKRRSSLDDDLAIIDVNAEFTLHSLLTGAAVGTALHSALMRFILSAQCSIPSAECCAAWMHCCAAAQLHCCFAALLHCCTAALLLCTILRRYKTAHMHHSAAAMHNAAGDTHAVRAALATGAKVDMVASAGKVTALLLACRAGDVEVVRELLAAAADPNHRR